VFKELEKMAKKKKRFYVVWQGRKTGIFESWNECKDQIHEFENAKYKSFESKEEAIKASESHFSKYIFKKDGLYKSSIIASKDVGEPILDSISVDGACEGNPGIAEYQGVNTRTKAKIFHGGPFQEGTNNIMEFLALVHAISYCKKKDIKVPIYSDSKIAINWIKLKKCKTKLNSTDKNAHLFNLIERETRVWGENPADFGRK